MYVPSVLGPVALSARRQETWKETIEKRKQFVIAWRVREPSAASPHPLCASQCTLMFDCVRRLRAFRRSRSREQRVPYRCMGSGCDPRVGTQVFRNSKPKQRLSQLPSASSQPMSSEEMPAAASAGEVAAPAAVLTTDDTGAASSLPPTTGSAKMPAVMPVAPAVGGESLSQQIKRLKLEQQQAKMEKQRVAKDLKNAQRRKSRLKKRARQLTDQDLVEVLQMRSDDLKNNASTPQPSDGADSSSESADD